MRGFLILTAILAVLVGWLFLEAGEARHAGTDAGPVTWLVTS